MFFKIVLMCFVFLDIPTAIYSYKSTPNVKKQLEIITSKIQEHIQSILQPLETLDDGRRDELKDFARVISDLYNDMAVKLQIQIEGFLEKYATVATDIEFGTMFNDPVVGSGHKEPTSKSGDHPTNPYVEDSDPLMPMVRARTTANAAEEEDLYIPNDPSVPTLSPKSSEEVDGNVIVFKTTPSNDHTQSHKTPHLPLYYDGGKQQYYPRDHIAAIEARKAKTKAQQKNMSTTKRMSSSEEERTRDINEEKKIQFKVIRSPHPEPDSLTTRQIHKLAGAFKRLQEQKFRKRTSSEEDREKEDKEENEETKSTTPRDNKTLALTSSEEEDLNRMTGKKMPTADLPADSSEEATPSSKRRNTKKRRSKKTTKSLPTTKKVKRTTKRFRPAVKKMKKFRPTKSPMLKTTPTTYDPFVMYPEDSAKEEED